MVVMLKDEKVRDPVESELRFVGIALSAVLYRVPGTSEPSLSCSRHMADERAVVAREHWRQEDWRQEHGRTT